jgi:hypothetical protein
VRGGGGGGSDRVNDMNGGIQEDGGGWRVEGPEGDSLVGQREVGGGGAGRGGAYTTSRIAGALCFTS